MKGYVLASGMYDLRGPRLSKRSSYVAFTDEVEDALSPQRHLSRISAPIVLLYGSLETPEFQRQSRDFAAALQKAGQAGRADRRRGLQPLRADRDARQSPTARWAARC